MTRIQTSCFSMILLSNNSDVHLRAASFTCLPTPPTNPSRRLHTYKWVRKMVCGDYDILLRLGDRLASSLDPRAVFDGSPTQNGVSWQSITFQVSLPPLIKNRRGGLPL
ncbi:hypothetical protein NPIL_684971 [Nephila pilipes]|uniref:Uncharacterized protein n=1 Tax=Nephila pilipes TaxID=299642 RepID=A0A8X6PDY7_NEPPI|nr:hypothetical protein NPIL_684971 [Nephila pilipes]